MYIRNIQEYVFFFQNDINVNKLLRYPIPDCPRLLTRLMALIIFSKVHRKFLISLQSL